MEGYRAGVSAADILSLGASLSAAAVPPSEEVTVLFHFSFALTSRLMTGELRRNPVVVYSQCIVRGSQLVAHVTSTQISLIPLSFHFQIPSLYINRYRLAHSY